MEIPADWDSRPPPKFANPRRRTLFRPDHVSFGKFILSEQMRDPVAEVARDIAIVAKANTPRGRDGSDGHIQDAYEVVREAGSIVVQDGAFSNPRVMVRVDNNHPRSVIPEFGNARAKRHRMLGRAGAAFGDMKGKAGL